MSSPSQRRDDASLLLLLAGDTAPSPRANDEADWSRLLFEPPGRNETPKALTAVTTPQKPPQPPHITPPVLQSQQRMSQAKPTAVDQATQTLLPPSPPRPSPPLASPNSTSADALRNDLAYLSVLIACARHHDNQYQTGW